MIITFIGNRPSRRFIRLGVIGNNLSDRLVLVVNSHQCGVDLTEFEPYIKMQNKSLTFADKTAHFVFDTDSETGKIKIIYLIPQKVTQQKSVDMQLIFQKSTDDNTIVWQSMIFNVTFDMSLDVSATIKKEYPDVLLDLETRIETLENMDSSSGGTTEGSSGVTECIDYDHFPEIGVAGVIYIDMAENISYRYDETTETYVPIGLQAEDINIINANGGI